MFTQFISREIWYFFDLQKLLTDVSLFLPEKTTSLYKCDISK